MRHAFTLADGIVTVSQFDADWILHERLGKAKTTYVIEPAVDTLFLDRPISERDGWHLGYCGSWIPRKGVDVLARDCARLLIHYPRCKLTLVGVGDKFQLSEWFPRSVHSQITSIPFIHNKAELRSIYDTISIFLFPSQPESFGLVVAEALASGCAVVTTRVGFSATLEDGKEAILMASGDSPHLFEAVKTLLENHELQRDIAKAGWKRVQHLRWSRAAEQLMYVYNFWLERFRKA